MAKYRQGEHILLFWPDEILYDVVRGHVTPEEFVRVVDRSYPCTDDEDPWPEPGIQHKWAFWGPPHEILLSEGCDRELYFRDAPGRGRFPVTVGFFRQPGLGFVSAGEA